LKTEFNKKSGGKLFSKSFPPDPFSKTFELGKRTEDVQTGDTGLHFCFVCGD
jgi:hypothetical protein